LRHAQGEIPEGVRDACIHSRAWTRWDDPVRARLNRITRWARRSSAQAAMVQLLLGNIGIAGGGMNALRGHSNIQGLDGPGLDVEPLAGYMDLAHGSEQDYAGFIKKRAAQPLRPNQLNYWRNYRAFHVSFMKSWWGANATAENNFGYRLSAEARQVLRRPCCKRRVMNQGKMNGYKSAGVQPAAGAPNKSKIGARSGEAEMARHHGFRSLRTSEFEELRRVLTTSMHRRSQTESVPLAATWFCGRARLAGSSSPRVAVPLARRGWTRDRRSRSGDRSGLWLRMRKAYKEQGGKYPNPIST